MELVTEVSEEQGTSHSAPNSPPLLLTAHNFHQIGCHALAGTKSKTISSMSLHEATSCCLSYSSCRSAHKDPKKTVLLPSNHTTVAWCHSAMSPGPVQSSYTATQEKDNTEIVYGWCSHSIAKASPPREASRSSGLTPAAASEDLLKSKPGLEPSVIILRSYGWPGCTFTATGHASRLNTPFDR